MADSEHRIVRVDLLRLLSLDGSFSPQAGRIIVQVFDEVVGRQRMFNLAGFFVNFFIERQNSLPYESGNFN